MDRRQKESIDSTGPGLSVGGLRLGADGKLFRGDAPIALPPLELKALRILLENSGRAVSYAQLRLAVGHDARVESDSLAKLIASLQDHLVPYANIQTVYKRGYRLVAAQASPFGGGVGVELPRLAILPLATGISVPEYLGYAVAEEVAAQLGRARHALASTASAHSIFRQFRRGLSPQEIGALLEVDLVLTGSIRALPAHYRLEAKMARASDGSQLWNADVLVEKHKLAGLEKELTDLVTFRLQRGGVSIFAEVDNDEQAGDPLRREAWENYQQAHQEWQSLERHHMHDALRRLTRAIELDPKLTAARVDLAHLCVAQSTLGYMSPATVASMIKLAATELVHLSSPPEAMLPMLGWAHFHVDRNLAAARKAFDLSAHLPDDLWVAHCRTMFALSRHRFEEAIELDRAILRHDSWSPQHYERLIWALHLAGKAEESIAQAVEAMERFVDHIPTHLQAAMVLAHNGQAARAEKLAREIAQRSPYSDLIASVHTYTLACAGREAEAREQMERLNWLNRERYVLTTHLPAIHAVLGEHDAALKHLLASDRSRSPWFFQMLADPRLKPLHGHPEFQAMQQILPAMEAAEDEREAAD